MSDETAIAGRRTICPSCSSTFWHFYREVGDIFNLVCGDCGEPYGNGFKELDDE